MIKKKIRLLSGTYKNSNIFFNNLNIKPTKSIIKKSLFSLIGNKIKNSKCLDLFSGTGSLGIESISRGANRIYFVDNKKKHLNNLKKNIERLKINIKKIKLINKCAKLYLNKKILFDIIFLDPPYKFYKMEKENLIIKSLKILKKKGLLYFENFKNQSIKFIKKVKIIKIGIKGNVIYYLIKKL
ncbi:16S rRNA (guanine(966)-N(2))-methyltransferase RsmD [Candidatus Vidania fulgoroideorum]